MLSKNFNALLPTNPSNIIKYTCLNLAYTCPKLLDGYTFIKRWKLFEIIGKRS